MTFSQSAYCGAHGAAAPSCSTRHVSLNEDRGRGDRWENTAFTVLGRADTFVTRRGGRHRRTVRKDRAMRQGVGGGGEYGGRYMLDEACVLVVVQFVDSVMSRSALVFC